jgi:hypothetical protein
VAAKVFISYRRDDVGGHAGRVYDRLKGDFGPDLLFMDVDAIPLGDNFVKVLNDEVSKCDVLLAIIGRGWLSKRGKRRLDNPHDFVRIEIATALKRGIAVIPILVDGARVPKMEQLPDDLKELALRQGLEVHDGSFHRDMDRLIRGLRDRKPTQQSIAPVPDLSGAWQGRWLSVRREREHLANLVIPVGHGLSFTASMTIAYERSGQKTIVEETFTAKLVESALSLVGVDYTYVQRGAASYYTLDNFNLKVSGDGKTLSGKAVLRHGARDISFVRIRKGSAT